MSPAWLAADILSCPTRLYREAGIPVGKRNLAAWRGLLFGQCCSNRLGTAVEYVQDGTAVRRKSGRIAIADRASLFVGQQESQWPAIIVTSVPRQFLTSGRCRNVRRREREVRHTSPRTPGTRFRLTKG
jgi:hypothetical protein